LFQGKFGNGTTLIILLNHGAALEAKEENNDTPLHLACWNDYLEMVKELVQRGADIFAKGEYGKTPLDASDGGSEVAKYLLEQYKEKLWKREGRLSLHTILRESTHLENKKVQVPIGTLMVDELLALFVSIYSQDTDSIRCQEDSHSWPLHMACHSNAPIEVFRLRIVRGMDRWRALQDRSR